MTPPRLTDEQRASARVLALESRRRRAEIRRLIGSGEMQVGDVLDRAADDEACAKLLVRDLLLSVPGVGAARCAAIMRSVGIANTRRVRGLGGRQARELRALFARETGGGSG